MSAYSRLIRLSRDDAQAARDTRHLGQGILKAKPARAFEPTSAGDQPHNTGLHFSSSVPMPLQFPPEILYAVIAYVEPIWLFQLEEAYPALAEILSTPRANKIWYDLLPPALISEPECFQDEGEVTKIRQALLEAAEQDKTICSYPSVYGVSTINHYMPLVPMVARTWSFKKSTINDTIILPQTDRLSKLSQNAPILFRNEHPLNDNQYPLITVGSKPTRARILALGGLYDQSISYRREIAGYLHTAQRCYICLEIFTLIGDKGFRSETCFWGMRWCRACLEQWTIPSEAFGKVSGLRPFLRMIEDGHGSQSVWVKRFTDHTQASWKPYVDELLRDSLGFDFDTAVAKEEYMRQVSKALTSTKQPITALRQALRREIVQMAQNLSTSPSYNNMPANLAKKSFARPTELSSFMFRPGLLHSDKMFDPYDPNEAWLSDPTQGLTLSRDVRRKLGDAEWKKQKAKEMLSTLFCPEHPGGGVTAFERAADQFHIRRISESISAETTIELLNQKFPPLGSPMSGLRSTCQRTVRIRSCAISTSY